MIKHGGKPWQISNTALNVEHNSVNGKGYAKATLETNDGKKTTVEYALTKESNAWKILGLRVGETQSATQQDNASSKLFADQTDHYTIQYPGDWSYKQTGTHTILFNGKEGTLSHGSTVIIQVIPAKSSSNVYKNVNDVIDDAKKQISTQTTEVQLSNTGTVELPTDPKHIHGESLVASYTYKGHALKQMQFILSRDGDQTFYSWTYTSPAEQYNNDLPLAKTMYESWKIE